jgi:FKBP-type peptidyl-prolyl cis-trans isomerase
MEAELAIDNIREGSGQEARTGQTVVVHYVGTLTNGKKFDSSRDRGDPFRFPLGGGQVIKGWDQGIVGMKVGGLRKLTIPPELGYGARGFPPVIPANATLVFEVELLEVR